MGFWLLLISGLILVWWKWTKDDNDPTKPQEKIKQDDSENDSIRNYDNYLQFKSTIEKSSYNDNTTQNRDYDYYDDSFLISPNEPTKFKKQFKIKYKDPNNHITERIVDMARFDHEINGGVLGGYCHLRDGYRTFRYSGILEMADMDTGEIVDTSKKENIKNYIETKYLESDQYKELIAKEEKMRIAQEREEYYHLFSKTHKNLITTLIYLSKCDGTFNAKEKVITSDVLMSLDENQYLDEALVKRIYKENDALPSPQSFKLSVGKVVDGYPNLNIYTIAKSIIDTQKTIHQNEAQALEFIGKKMQSN